MHLGRAGRGRGADGARAGRRQGAAWTQNRSWDPCLSHRWLPKQICLKETPKVFLRKGTQENKFSPADVTLSPSPTKQDLNVSCRLSISEKSVQTVKSKIKVIRTPVVGGSEVRCSASRERGRWGVRRPRPRGGAPASGAQVSGAVFLSTSAGKELQRRRTFRRPGATFTPAAGEAAMPPW